QGRIGERRPVEFPEMGIAAEVFLEHGIADVVERRAVLLGGQGAKEGAAEMFKAHAVSFRRYCKCRDPLGRPMPSAAASGLNGARKPLKTKRIRRKHKRNHNLIPVTKFVKKHVNSRWLSGPCAKGGCPERPCGLRVCLLRC